MVMDRESVTFKLQYADLYFLYPCTGMLSNGDWQEHITSGVYIAMNLIFFMESSLKLFVLCCLSNLGFVFGHELM